MRSIFNIEILRSIRGSLGRFLAIAAIVALGCGFYAGLRMTAPDMDLAADEYYDASQLMDVRIVSTMGLTTGDIEAIENVDGVGAVEGAFETDASATIKGEQYSVRMHSLPYVVAPDDDESDEQRMFPEVSTDAQAAEIETSANTLNKLELTAGTWPTQEDECIISADRVMSVPTDIGDKMQLIEGSQDLDDTLKYREYTIVGFAHSPYYVSTTAMGSTTLGSGSIEQFMYVPANTFSADLPFTEAFVQVEGAAAEFAGSDAYQARVDEVMANIKAIAGECEQRRYDDIRGEAQAELDDARAEYEQKRADAEAELSDAKSELDNAQAKLTSGQRDLNRGQKEYDDGVATLAQERQTAQEKLDDAQRQIDESAAKLEDAKAQLEAARQEVEAGEQELSAGRAEVAAGQRALEAKRPEYEQAKALVDNYDQNVVLLGQIKDQIATTPDGPQKDELIKQEKELEYATSEQTQTQAKAGIAQFEQGQAQLAAARQELAAGEQELAEGKRQLEEAEAQYAEGEHQLEEGRQQLDEERANAETQLNDAQAKLDSAAKTLKTARADLASGRTEYNDGVAEYDKGRAEADDEFAKAESELSDAQADIDSIEMPEWLVMDRTKTPGTVSFESDADRVDSIAAFFPFIFFLVAALVALTTMTRMVEEERPLIGTLKALGYSRGRITSKYLIYAAAASVAGAVFGIVLLSLVLPPIIMEAYAIIYSVPHKLIMPIDPCIALIAGGMGVGVTLIATWAAAASTLRETPANLMRPRVPKEGKRILLERIGPLWRRLTFSWKVTFRNIFRYKKRLIMTVIGIAGCTGLLLTGLALQDSINDIIDKQFGQTVLYNVEVTCEDDASEQSREELEGLTESFAWAYDEAEMASGPAKSDVSVSLVVPENPDKFQQLWVVRTRIGHDALTLDGAGAIITEKLANILGLKVGDSITLADQDKMGNATADTRDIPVQGIMENYIANYVFVTPAVYEDKFGSTPAFNTMFAAVGSTEESHDAFRQAVDEIQGVKTIAFNDETIDSYRKMLRSVNMIVVVLVVAAAVLAFIVLYNLTNINITERAREIATLKVLGFTPREVDMYIYRETMLLSVLGALLGLGFGVVLAGFVIQTAEVDYVMFGRDIHFTSYIVAFIVTLVFAVVVMLFMRPKLAKIDMVESLKSNE